LMAKAKQKNANQTQMGVASKTTSELKCLI